MIITVVQQDESISYAAKGFKEASYFPCYYEEDGQNSTMETWEVPEYIAEKLIKQGTEQQEFSDGYAAYTALSIRGTKIY
jgi:hypothetical protein